MHIVTLVAFLHVLVAVFLVIVVLLQDSKGGGMGGAFGGGSSQTIFGASGAANFMVKVTRVLAVTFMGTCMFLTYYLSQRTAHSVVDTMPTNRIPVTAPLSQPVTAQPPADSAPAATNVIPPAPQSDKK